MNYIYGYKNKINNKWYVGQTTTSLSERHRLHVSGATHKAASDYDCLFHKKLREYGLENFELIELEQVQNKEDLDERECYWIQEKHSFVRDNGYNLTLGGQKRKKDENYIDIRARFQTPEEINSVIQDIKNQNLSLKEIAEKYNVALSFICSINSGAKYQKDNETYPLRPIKRQRLKKEVVLEIIELLKQNFSNKAIGELFEIDSDIVYKINYGKAYVQPNETYPIRQSLSPQEERAIKIKQLLKEGHLNNKEIAKIVKCDPSVVSNINYGKNYYDEHENYPLRKS